MLSRLDRDRPDQFSQVNDQCLFLFDLGTFFIFDQVLRFEFESVVDANVVGSDAGFLFELSQSALPIGFAPVDMALRQVPTVGVFHQQETAIDILSVAVIISKDQKSTRLYFF